MSDETLRTAFQSWETLSGTQEEVLAYEARLKKVLDEEAAIREAELREQEARQRGMQKGIKEGIQQGMQQGMQKEKEITARRLLARGMSIEEVIEITELDEQLIREMGE